MFYRKKKKKFGFRQQYSTWHALTNITEGMRKAIDDGNIDIGVFVYLQKAFDSVYHQILSAKLSHYGIRFKWSYLPNRNQSYPEMVLTLALLL